MASYAAVSAAILLFDNKDGKHNFPPKRRCSYDQLYDVTIHITVYSSISFLTFGIWRRVLIWNYRKWKSYKGGNVLNLQLRYIRFHHFLNPIIFMSFVLLFGANFLFPVPSFCLLTCSVFSSCDFFLLSHVSLNIRLFSFFPFNLIPPYPRFPFTSVSSLSFSYSFSLIASYLSFFSILYYFLCPLFLFSSSTLHPLIYPSSSSPTRPWV
jgi:hypothetical protein